MDHEVGAGDTVDRGVVHLGDHADVPVLESFDDPQLPERTVAVERAAGDLAGDLRQLAVGTGRGRR